MTMPTNTSRIVGLKISAIKRIVAVDLKPGGPMVVIAGRNAQGKSSVLDSIAYALAGKGAIPSEPLRHGADKGEVVVTTDDGFRIKRTFTSAGGGTLTVENADGDRKASPQAWLDARISGLSFDPLAFTRLPPKAQAERLRALVGVDTTALDAERAAAYSERTTVNRIAADAEAHARSLQRHDDATDAETPYSAPVVAETVFAETVSVVALAAAVADAEQKARRRAERERDADDGTKRVKALRQQIEEMAAQANQAEIAAKSAAEDAASITVPDIAALRETMASAEQRNRTAQAAADEANRLARAEAEQANRDARLAVDVANRKARENAVYKAAEDRAAAKRAEADALTKRIADIDGNRAAMLAEARFPVDGLSFGPGGVTYQGVPFDQASSAEQLRVSMAMGLAANANLRVVLIREGSLLDAESMQMIADMAAAASAQVWVERVGTADEGAIVIEDGSAVVSP